jgi:rubredoxin
MTPRFKGQPTFDLFEQCRLCGYKIQPHEAMRLHRDRMLCPKCGQTFNPMEGKKPPQSTS